MLIKKILIIGISFLFLGTCITPSVAVNNPINPISSGNTLYVGGTGPGNYTTIQDALDDANPGDTIYVYNGTYYESLRITKRRITLIGQSKEGTIINSPPSYADCPLFIFASFVKVDGFTLTNKDNTIITTYGVFIQSSFNTISNCNIIDNSFNGICIYSFSYYNKIYGNTIKHSHYGIQTHSSNNMISYNNFIDNFCPAHDEFSNSWDNGEYGNYWDVYEGEDKDGDGIGDTPFHIPGGANKDRFPLMKPIDTNEVVVTNADRVLNKFDTIIPRTRASSYLWLDWLMDKYPLLEVIISKILTL